MKWSNRVFLPLIVLLVIVTPALATNPDPPFMRSLFSPELVMQNQRAIGLRAEQRKAITRAIQKTQSETVELQWDMQDAAHLLGREIAKDPIDEKAALSVAERMMEIEAKVKRAHLGLLIQIRNQLDPKQRDQLRRLRDSSK